MIRLIVCGAGGRMGGRILELASRNPEFKVVGAVESAHHPALGNKILDGQVAVSSDLAALAGAADVLIDFTAPEATLEHLKAIQGSGKISAVIGTTGFSDGQLAEIKTISQKIPIVLSPNMSVGVNLMFELVRAAARKISNYDIEITETHHNQKKDAPSGTAIALAKEIADELKRNFDKDVVYGRKGNVGARPPKEIAIHAIRAGDVVGDHKVVFATGGERLEITHKASSRDAFATGALRAAIWIKGKKPGFYSMKDVLA